MKKESKRYNSHHYIYIMDTIDRLITFLNENTGGEKVKRATMLRECDEDLIEKYKKKYPAFAKSEKLRGDT